jgi:hypothetical protein
VESYLAWVNAVSTGHEQEAAFLEDRFRPEFRLAFEKWKSMANNTDSIPPGTPFSLPEYQLPTQEQSIS